MEEVPEIPIFEIMEKPTVKITTIKDFLKDNDIKITLIKRMVEDVSQNENNISVNQNPSNSNNSTNNNLYEPAYEMNSNIETLSRYLSPNMIKKLQAKEEAVNMSKSILEYSTQKNKTKRGANNMKEIVDKIKTIFILHKSACICLTQLINKIFDSSENIRATYSLDNLKNIIYKLKDVFPQWLTIIEHSSLGLLVKLNNTLPMIQIISKLEDADLVAEIEYSA